MAPGFSSVLMQPFIACFRCGRCPKIDLSQCVPSHVSTRHRDETRPDQTLCAALPDTCVVVAFARPSVKMLKNPGLPDTPGTTSDSDFRQPPSLLVLAPLPILSFFVYPRHFRTSDSDPSIKKERRALLLSLSRFETFQYPSSVPGLQKIHITYGLTPHVLHARITH